MNHLSVLPPSVAPLPRAGGHLCAKNMLPRPRALSVLFTLIPGRRPEPGRGLRTARVVALGGHRCNGSSVSEAGCSGLECNVDSQAALSHTVATSDMWLVHTRNMAALS